MSPSEIPPSGSGRFQRQETETTVETRIGSGPVDDAVGQTLGRYKLLECIGEGGCGVVYVAEQTEPVRRRVALKVIKLGMDTKAVVARFEAERQALAMMDHPNIARVLDAGSTGTGRPYFVMELVRGIRITEYCDQANLATEARIELFIHVCQAIQHAHQKGIIHRDIKPSNILVTLHDGVPVPKVIDFGIAKATEGRLTDATVYTQLNQFIGTPTYMSPEQAEMSGLDIDTRSDIYSLGVLLYELLTGRTPFDANELLAQGLDVMRKTIREKDPARPSTRISALRGEELTTAARRRSIDGSRWAIELQGDLDWIVMKCLEKDRTRRYETATGLAADLRRHLDDEPVSARPPSAGYRFQKAWRRNKLALAAGGAVGAALLVASIVSAYSFVQERRARLGEQAQRQEAESAALRAQKAQAMADRSRQEAERMASFLINDLFQELKPTGQSQTLLRICQSAVDHFQNLPAELQTPVTRQQLALARAQLGVALLAVPNKGEEISRLVGLVREALPKPDQPQSKDETVLFPYLLSLSCESGLAVVQNQSCPPTVREGVAQIEAYALSTNASPQFRRSYAELLNDFGHLNAGPMAVPIFERSLNLLASLGARTLDDLTAASAWSDIADSEARHLLAAGRSDEAARLEMEALRLADGVLARRPSDQRALRVLYFANEVLGRVEAQRLHDSQALSLFRKSEQATLQALRFDPNEPMNQTFLLAIEANLSALLWEQGEMREALRLGELSFRRATFGRRNSIPMMQLAQALVLMQAMIGNRPEAEQLVRDMRRALEQSDLKLVTSDIQYRIASECIQSAERRISLILGDPGMAHERAHNDSARLVQDLPRERDATANHAIRRLRLQALGDQALSALQLGRPAETLNLVAMATPLLQEQIPVVETSDIEIRHLDENAFLVIKAEALIGLNRDADALVALDLAEQQLDALKPEGRPRISRRLKLGRIHALRALASPKGDKGSAVRTESIARSESELKALGPEASTLSEVREIQRLLDSARKRS